MKWENGDRGLYEEGWKTGWALLFVGAVIVAWYSFALVGKAAFFPDRSDAPLTYWQVEAGICPGVHLGYQVTPDCCPLPVGGDDASDDGLVSIDARNGVLVLRIPETAQDSGVVLNVFVDVAGDGGFNLASDWLVRNLPIADLRLDASGLVVVRFVPVNVLTLTWLRLMIGSPLDPISFCPCRSTVLACGEVEDYRISGTSTAYCAECLPPICPGCPPPPPPPPTGKTPCNQGVGNGPEGCDPGRSAEHRGTNDECIGCVPGNPGHNPHHSDPLPEDEDEKGGKSRGKSHDK